MKIKKILSTLAIAGVIISGCAHKGVVKETQQPQSNKQITAEKQTGDKESNKNSQGNIGSKTEAVDSIRLIKELQAKMKDIHFDFDRYIIKNDEKPNLKQVANILRSNHNLKVTIEGNCDEKGTTEYNLALGDRRAVAAKDYLLSLGTPSGRMDTLSNGKDKPLCTKHTEACWAKNRRDHFALEQTAH